MALGRTVEEFIILSQKGLPMVTILRRAMKMVLSWIHGWL